MCGNGIRCVAKVLYDRDPALRRPALRIETGAGVLACDDRREDGRVRTVTVEMGRPRLHARRDPDAPRRHRRARCEQPISARGRDAQLTGGLDGQPARGDLRRRRGDAARAGRGVRARCSRRRALFPRRTNVEFAHVRSARRDRSRGRGSAAAASRWRAAPARARRSSPPAWRNACRRGRETTVHLPGGPLSITVEKDYSTVRMRGPARSLFEASIDVAPPDEPARTPLAATSGGQNSVPCGRDGVDDAGGGRPRCS